MRPLEGRVLLASGATRGVGRAVVSAAASAGADVAVILRAPETGDSPDLVEIASAAASADRRLLRVTADLREESDLQSVVDEVLASFGRIDILVNGAEASCVDSTLGAGSEIFRLMVDVNLHGTYLLGRAALPHVLASEHGQVLTVSPPVDLAEESMGSNVPWSVSKYAATLLTLGWAAEFGDWPFSANTLWPHRPIRERDDFDLVPRRSGPVFLPAIMGDAAVELLRRPAGEVTGRSLLDAEVLAASGIRDLGIYQRPPADVVPT